MDKTIIQQALRKLEGLTIKVKIEKKATIWPPRYGQLWKGRVGKNQADD